MRWKLYARPTAECHVVGGRPVHSLKVRSDVVFSAAVDTDRAAGELDFAVLEPSRYLPSVLDGQLGLLEELNGVRLAAAGDVHGVVRSCPAVELVAFGSCETGQHAQGPAGDEG